MRSLLCRVFVTPSPEAFESKSEFWYLYHGGWAHISMFPLPFLGNGSVNLFPCIMASKLISACICVFPPFVPMQRFNKHFPSVSISADIKSHEIVLFELALFVVMAVKLDWNRESDSFYGWQSVSQYVLMSSPLCGRLTRYCFLLKSLGLEFVGLSLWGALSVERPGLSFVSHSLVICLCVHLLFTFLSFTLLPYTYIYTLHNTYNIYKASFSPGSLQQIMPYYLLVAHATTAVWTLEQSITWPPSGLSLLYFHDWNRQRQTYNRSCYIFITEILH
jgi:hypothetical protein